MKKARKSLRQEVLEAVMSGKERTTDVVHAVTKSISASQAVRAGRSYYRWHQDVVKKPSLMDLDHQGRHKIVARYLSNLVQEGKIVRIAKGKYGPPRPKLFDPAQSA